MVGLLVDEDVPEPILEGLLRREPPFQVISVRTVGLAQTHDTLVLAGAAERGLVVVTCDRNTLVGYAYERVAAGLPMSSVVVVPQQANVGVMIDDLLFLVEAGLATDFTDQVRYLPL